MMGGRFLTPLDTRYVGPQRKTLLDDLVYEAASGTLYTVPAGFESDGASVPRWLWWLYPPFGEAYEPATWLHDYLYRHADHIIVDGIDEISITREQADALMEEASASCGFRAAGHHLMHMGVRAGGRRTWDQHRAAAAAAAVY